MKFFLSILTILALSITGVVTNSVSAADVNDFRIASFDIQYNLSKDDTNHSVLKTTETITANFKNANVNRGIERALPTTYNGHPTKLDNISVKDGTGATVQYSSSTQGDMKVLRIGDPDAYANGVKTYTIEYTQRDVTRFYQDTTRDEWYWDTNGTQWKVPIDQLRVTATINPDVQTSFVGKPQCYQGKAGATNTCEITNSNNGRYTVQAAGLNAGENVTIALGFEEGTFAQYQQTTFERLTSIWLVAFVITSIVAVLAFIYLTVQLVRRYNRTSELHTIVTEYIPPKDTSVLVASKVVVPKGSVFSAQLIDFAVRHFIEIIETKPKSFWSVAEYDIKVISDPSRLHEEEQELFTDMFGKLPSVGDRVALSALRRDRSYYKRTLDNDKKINDLVIGSYALVAKSPIASRYFYKWAIGLLIAGVLTLSPSLLIVAGIVALYGLFIYPLTDKGLELRRYLLGLDKYIKAAEAERLKFLQSPDTAQKIGESVNVGDTGQLVKLYERVLPYAIMFGHEKEWSKRLGDYYGAANTAPEWYSGSSAFNAVIFASAISNFSTAASYSGGAASASSGGSGGGGASGGGGGGGGGGGW
jgi:hypothetical protein